MIAFCRSEWVGVAGIMGNEYLTNPVVSPEYGLITRNHLANNLVHQY